ncbi:MAG: hypothetical protein ABIJ97_10620 [Bacteroidota bacterium]
MDNDIIKWLLNSDPWTEYRTRIDLLDESHDDSMVKLARERMIKHSNVNSLIIELTDWPGTVLSSHKSASQSYHKLSFIADLGFVYDDPKISGIINKIFKHISTEGPFQLPINIPVHFGGLGQDQYAWALCDAPIIIYSLSKLGLHNNKQVIKAKDYLVKLGEENGYPCKVSKELGKFRGPGRKADPCPYATMIMLKLINLYDSDKNSKYAIQSINSFLNLWEKSESLHPYMFYMGTDFRKLKAPLIWYDILHFADTLSNYSYAIKDKRFKEIVKLIEQKADENGKFIPESIWKVWNEWDFGQKKQPSAWLTFLVYRIKKRMITNK